MLESLGIQALMFETLMSMPEVYQGSHIITNLSDSFESHGGGLEERWCERITNSLYYGNFKKHPTWKNGYKSFGC